MIQPYVLARLDDIPSPVAPEPGSYAWKPVRHHLGVRAFGVNANVAKRAGDVLVGEHDELEGSGTRHEELYLVLRGSARFTIGGQEADAAAGTLVFVPDPATLRSAVALEPDTAVLAIGAEPGTPYRISPWERKYFPED